MCPQQTSDDVADIIPEKRLTCDNTALTTRYMAVSSVNISRVLCARPSCMSVRLPQSPTSWIKVKRRARELRPVRLCMPRNELLDKRATERQKLDEAGDDSPTSAAAFSVLIECRQREARYALRKSAGNGSVSQNRRPAPIAGDSTEVVLVPLQPRKPSPSSSVIDISERACHRLYARIHSARDSQ
ncbi:hypothetical protein SKAU_G00147110 [Synaphobranchus kaupii]|uniref:Uncharacterized protein n=1 Tax=Synaphobranchus kaupii TaxID=118154 RepID=A0A9Q1FUC3_SYNKA|nr:hypothetical protein SKAU_G00147110 [Synaphobranchus kaupii]